jgi:hypothetical protein
MKIATDKVAIFFFGTDDAELPHWITTDSNIFFEKEVSYDIKGIF